MATAGILSAAVLTAPGCGPEPQGPRRDESVELASFRTLAARAFLATCPGAAGRDEMRFQDQRFDELRQLAAGKDLDHSIWLGENRWNGIARYSDREPCPPGEQAFGEALAAYSGALDVLAGRLAEANP